MNVPAAEIIERYYDDRVEAKLRDFTGFNPRIEAAIETLAEWAPLQPRSILEIGCGIGATSWRMARAWPKAHVIGTDISSVSIDVARTCFQLPNLSYHAGRVEKGTFNRTFDLILMMDVYEHIVRQDRGAFHAVLASLLGPESRMVFSVPTPKMLQTLRTNSPQSIQPVDEDVTLMDVAQIAAGSGTTVVYFREVGIWRYGDYAHFVLARYRHLKDVALREFRPPGFAGLKHRVKRFIGRGPLPDVAQDYLGTDLLRPRRFRPAQRFRVSAAERKQCAARWRAVSH